MLVWCLPPCQDVAFRGALANRGDLCRIHGGGVDPRELGRKGGSAPRASLAELPARIPELDTELWRHSTSSS